MTRRPRTCIELGVCQARPGCTQSGFACPHAQRRAAPASTLHPFAPGAIERHAPQRTRLLTLPNAMGALAAIGVGYAIGSMLVGLFA